MSDTTINIKRGPYRRDYYPLIGDTFNELGFYITEAGSAADLSGDTFDMVIKNTLTGDAAFTLTNGSGITVSSNFVQVHLSATDTADLLPVKYQYDIQWTRSTGYVKTLVAGFIYPQTSITPA